ncbi:G/U mismatch-specific DNA glycosylase (plasmid) [Bradyrhizobium betae]
MSETADRLMDLAEARIREAGYRGFSFRDLAAEIGIKSASVHHHFPTKAGMAAAVARRYGERFFELVGRREGETPDDVIEMYRAIFRQEIERDGRMCLNGILGAEAGDCHRKSSTRSKPTFADASTIFRAELADPTPSAGPSMSWRRSRAVLSSLAPMATSAHSTTRLQASSPPRSRHSLPRPSDQSDGPAADRSKLALHRSATALKNSMTSYQPDILASGLKVIFCGLNPGISAERSGHSFSTPSNRFWTVLHLASFTDVRIAPKDEQQLLAYGCGITAVVRRPTRRASEVSAREFADARASFEARIASFAPRSIAFLGKRAIAGMLQVADVAWGRQPMTFGGAPAWVLPNPSGLNRGYSLDALVEAYSAFRTEIEDAADLGCREHDPCSDHSTDLA